MRDLYLQLGVDPGASVTEIETAIKARPELTTAADILLNAQRRAAYQRTVATMRSIGMLRHRLGLDNEPSWFVETCADFAPRMHRKYVAKPEPDAEPMPATVPDHAGQTPPVSQTKAISAGPVPANQPRRWLNPLLIVVGIALLLILLNTVL